MLNERKLTERELDKRTEAIQGLLSNKRTLVKKYGKDAEKVMYGIATKQAKNKVEGMNKDKIKELIQTALQKEETTYINLDGTTNWEYFFSKLQEDKELDDYNSEFSDDEESQERIDNEDYPLKEDKFSNDALNDVMQSIRNLSNTTGMDELEAAEIAINEIRIEFGVDAFHESALDKRVAKIDEMIDYDMNEEVTKSEEEKLKKISKELKGASKMHASQSKKIAKLVKEKLTKKSSVEDHVEDFKDSNAPQFKGKSKDKKVQMAVAAYLSKKNK